MIPYAAVDNDLQFYSYPGNLYTHESVSEDNDDIDVTNDDKHVNRLDVKIIKKDMTYHKKKTKITKSSTDSQQKSKLYAPFKSPLLKNPPNKESPNHYTNINQLNPHQEQNCLQVQSQAQNYPNLQVQST